MLLGTSPAYPLPSHDPPCPSLPFRPETPEPSPASPLDPHFCSSPLP